MAEGKRRKDARFPRGRAEHFTRRDAVACPQIKRRIFFEIQSHQHRLQCTSSYLCIGTARDCTVLHVRPTRKGPRSQATGAVPSFDRGNPRPVHLQIETPSPLRIAWSRRLGPASGAAGWPAGKTPRSWSAPSRQTRRAFRSSSSVQACYVKTKKARQQRANSSTRGTGHRPIERERERVLTGSHSSRSHRNTSTTASVRAQSSSSANSSAV